MLKGAICPILDVSFGEAVARSTLTETAKRKADNSLSSHDFIELWNIIIDLAGPRFDPLSLGRKMANGPLVPILLAFTCAPNLRVGLQRMARYKALFGPVIMVLSEGRDGLRLDFRGETDDIDLPASMAVPMSIFIVEKARNHSAREINPVYIALPPSLLNASEAEAYFHCRPVPSDVTALRFTDKQAKLPFISQNEALWLEVERELESQVQEQNASRPFHLEVETAIRTQIYAGPTHVEAICDMLGISRSTLQRRLREDGYGFQEILDRVRFGLAIRFLTRSEFSISEISRMVGFLDPKSFFRAFKQKFGKTPEQYREQNTGRQ